MNSLSINFFKKPSVINKSGVIVLFFCLLIVSISLFRVRQVNAAQCECAPDDHCYGTRQGFEQRIRTVREQYHTSRQYFVEELYSILGLSGPAYGIGGFDDASTIHDLRYEIDPWGQRHPDNIGGNAYNEAQKQLDCIRCYQDMIRRCFPDDMMEDETEEEEVEEEEQEEEKQEEGPIRGPHAWVKQTGEPPWCGPLELDIYTCSPLVSEWQGTVDWATIFSWNISFVPNIGREITWRYVTNAPRDKEYWQTLTWQYLVTYVEGDVPQLKFDGTCTTGFVTFDVSEDAPFTVPIEFGVDDRCDNPPP